MQIGVGAFGRGQGPLVAPPPPPPPPGRSSYSASVSPSSSSSVVSAPAHLGFESLQQQQQLALRQQQLQQLRKPEQENVGAVRGIVGGRNFPLSSGVPTSNFLRNLPHDYTRIPGDTKQNVPDLEQKQNCIHQAYGQFAMQAAQHQQRTPVNTTAEKVTEFGMMGPPAIGQEILVKNFKMQEKMLAKAGNQTQNLRCPDSVDHSGRGEKHNEQNHMHDDQKNELKTPPTATGQFTPINMIRPLQFLQSQGSMENVSNKQLMLAHLQVMQAWAMEYNIDLTIPDNANLIAAQLLPILQSNRLAGTHTKIFGSTPTKESCFPTSKLEVVSSFANENSVQENSMNNLSGQTGMVRSTVSVLSVLPNSSNTPMQHPHPVQTLPTQNERSGVSAEIVGSSGSVVYRPQRSMSSSQSIDLSNGNKSSTTELLQMQPTRHFQNIGHPTSLSASTPCEVAGSRVLSLRGSEQAGHQHFGFTKQQLHVLKAQILAFRRLKHEHALPPEVLQAIIPPPLDSQTQVAQLSTKMTNKEEKMGGVHERNPKRNIPQPAPLTEGHFLPKEWSVGYNAPLMTNVPVEAAATREDAGAITAKEVPEIYPVPVKFEQDVDRDSTFKGENDSEKGNSVASTNVSVDVGHIKKSVMENVSLSSNAKKYFGPLFDLPSFNKSYDILGLTSVNSSNNFSLVYDIKEFLYEEGKQLLRKKRMEYSRKLNNLLALNLKMKRIKPDLTLRLRIEEKKLRLLDIQSRLRDEIDEQQQDILALPDRPYRKFIRQCECQRQELMRQVQQLQKETREKQLKSIFQWRKKFLETHWVIRDARTTRNRGVAKYHERMLREFYKNKDDDRSKRLEALKNNDVDRYREMLIEQQTSIPGDAAQRYTVLSSFLSQTEEYLHKLGNKIMTSKKQHDVEEAAAAAAAAARSQGLSEEEINGAAACAREELMIRNTFSEMNAPIDRSSVNKYYNLAHAVNEKVLRQPSMLRAGTLRDYQLIGLQWMLSLYNNKLNGILADEMGLGKTVQVMALIAYLMEFKGNYGPHLIIVPNAVLLNWKSELHNWLPSVSSIFYVGAKEERSRLFSLVVSAMKFNVLVTTYEFVMYDRSKLSRIDWKYIFIDEAQRMKDRESILARDLDRYHCQRRLLLTGTPLQNDLKELWSLLNLLLPEVFDNRTSFHDWFSKPFQKDVPSHNQEDDWLETEKKVIVIHRLHQILEPFMLRRRVEDVEGSLPPKVSIVLRCRMSALQGAIYNWIKSTGTIKLDPEDELQRAARNPMYQLKMYKNLNNKCMELRKACNHPLLNYPYFNDYSKEFLVRSCGKLWILDRILLKLQKAGHRVLLFSTMTKLLDILEEYLEWRQLVYRRIDGTTSLEDRESSIVDFNRPDSDCFIFLLSIRAAGRGLNLQSADTVVIYDPDPNPQNEEQALARAHRIGQEREVKVIYMEAVVDKISSHKKEDELRNGGNEDSEDDLAGKNRYVGSIESLIRSNIQQYKIDMADEVINAGCFDQRTTHEERRMTLEALLHDEERYQEMVYDVPSFLEVNRLIARSEEEVELFDQMDEELDWTGEMTNHNQVPLWLRSGSTQLNTVVSSRSKKPSKLGGVFDLESLDVVPVLSPSKTERKRRQNSTINQKYSAYVEFDEDGGDSDASSEEGNVYSSREEGREIEDIGDEYINGGVDLQENDIDPLESEGLVCDGAGSEYSDAIEGRRHTHICDEAGSSGSSFGNRRLQQSITRSISLHKFESLSELDARSGVFLAKKNELEEGEIAGNSHTEIQQSVSWNHGRDDGEDEQTTQPRLKRKRSKRFFSKHVMEKQEEKCSSYMSSSQYASKPLLHVHCCNDIPSRMGGGMEKFDGPSLSRHGVSPSSLKDRSNFQTKRAPAISIQKSRGFSYLSDCVEDTLDHSRESWNGWASNTSVPGPTRGKMSENMQRKFKNVIGKLRRRIDTEGGQLVPIFYDLWKKIDSSDPSRKFSKKSNPFNLRSIDQRVESLGYTGVSDFVADVQSMLKNVVQYCKFSREVIYEARKLQDILFYIMKIVFPDFDFGKAKKDLTFPIPGNSGAATKLPIKPCSIIHGTQLRLEGDPRPPPRSAPRPWTSKANFLPYDEYRQGAQVNVSSSDGTRPRSIGSSLEKSPADRSLLRPLPAHPGDLVIRKRKRSERDKSWARLRMGLLSPMNVRRSNMLFSPPNVDRGGPSLPVRSNHGVSSRAKIDSPRPAQKTAGLVHSEARPTHKASGFVHSEARPIHKMAGLVQSEVRQQKTGWVSNMEELQWPRRVKRIRTDTGKRRPVHL